MPENIDVNKDAWEQQENEPRLWFERFDLYRLLGPSRTVPKAYRKWRYGSLQSLQGHGKNNNHQWYEIAERWKWQERAEAWDDTVREDTEDEALAVYNDGLSFAHERVRKLKLIAAKLEEFILDPSTTRISPFVIEQYRQILNDIALERGERQKTHHITGGTEQRILIETQWGRGGSISEAWKQLPQPQEVIVEAVITEESTHE